SVGPVSTRATNPYASGTSSHGWREASVATTSTTTPPATRRAETSLTGFGKLKRFSTVRECFLLAMTVRKSTYRSLPSLQRDNRRCRACAEAGYPLESLPVWLPYTGQRAYLFGQAPGVVEGAE